MPFCFEEQQWEQQVFFYRPSRINITGHTMADDRTAFDVPIVELHLGDGIKPGLKGSR